MSTQPFPTKLADLILNDSDINPSIYATLKSIRKATLSIPNRLKSVLADAKFAKQVADRHHLPLIANERCGSWYIDPSNKVGSAYFKSTDGHHGKWDFSLRRLNLQILPILGSSGGAVVVDSTRRGKNLPDAFSKTVPIWVAVINRALFPELGNSHLLQHPPPPDNLGESEVSQMEARLNGFVESFVRLGLDLAVLRDQLKRPIRLSWAINGQIGIHSSEEEPQDQLISSSPTADEIQSNQLVLCSASRRVLGAEVSEGGYIQGAGDDSEGWAHGLTAQTFWKHREQLMQSPEESVVALIEKLTEQEKEENRSHVQPTRIAPATQLHIGTGRASKSDGYDLIVNCEDKPPETDSKILNLECRSGKLGSKDLRDKLPMVSNVISEQLHKDPHCQILITCATGKDLSVGVVVSALCLLYSDEGQLRDTRITPVVDKTLVKQRLAWITRSKADANPSRATLQAVNSFLMQPPG